MWLQPESYASNQEELDCSWDYESVQNLRPGCLDQSMANEMFEVCFL